MQLACLCLDLCIVKLQKEMGPSLSLFIDGSSTSFKGLSILHGQQRDRLISIACRSITLDFRDYDSILVDRSNNSLQRSLEDLKHYKFLPLSGSCIWISPGDAGIFTAY